MECGYYTIPMSHWPCSISGSNSTAIKVVLWKKCVSATNVSERCTLNDLVFFWIESSGCYYWRVSQVSHLSLVRLVQSISTICERGGSKLKVPIPSAMCAMRFIDEFWLLGVLLINAKHFSPWRQQTGSGHPEQSPMCVTAEIDCANLVHSIDKSRPPHRISLLSPYSPLECARDTEMWQT